MQTVLHNFSNIFDSKVQMNLRICSKKLNSMFRLTVDKAGQHTPIINPGHANVIHHQLGDLGANGSFCLYDLNIVDMLTNNGEQSLAIFLLQQPFMHANFKVLKIQHKLLF